MAPIAADLTEEKRKQICALLGNVELSLLYKASVHGYQASAFHERCDNQGPTLLVAYNRLGYVFGGYTSVVYAQKGQQITDKEAFLFSIRDGAPLFIKVNSGCCARSDDAGMPNFGQQLYFCYENQPVVEKRRGNSFSFTSEKLYGDTSELTECEVYKVKQSKSIIREKTSY
ncbi:hypothetical protein M9458_044078 [Cirrhinus mrigala]|uniref:TLDc domain-containing protein n=1 Tax=Cirrhinus mrigala TaxID=683832 RepID=A0ABD0NJ45_CIRMR